MTTPNAKAFGPARRLIAKAASATLLTALAAGTLGFAPEPDPIPRRWQLDVKLGPLRLAKFDVPGSGPRAFFYMTYTVTNASGTDVLLAPAWDLATSDGEIVRSGRNVPASVTEQLIKNLNNPYLEDQISIIGVMMQGEENAKDGLVVWAVDDFRVDEVSIFGAGFSGEAKPMEILNPETDERERVLLRKTLMSRYITPGDIERHVTPEFESVETRWIMR
ncbi:MAG: hypothetical protein GIKADHBN_01398 [Phycisphaerales bacterium]|nr:hypothetical protein [Phycisphaerales bacterium]